MITRKSRRNDTRAFLLSSNGNSYGNSRCCCNTSGRGLNLTRSKGLNVAGEQRRRSIRRDRTRVITEFRRHSAAGRFDLLLFTKSLCSCSTAAEHGKRAGFSARWLRYQKTVGKNQERYYSPRDLSDNHRNIIRSDSRRLSSSIQPSQIINVIVSANHPFIYKLQSIPPPLATRSACYQLRDARRSISILQR